MALVPTLEINDEDLLLSGDEQQKASSVEGEDTMGIPPDRFTSVSAHLRGLLNEMHVPFLDVRLYRKYVLSKKTDENLYKLCMITKTVIEHKRRTTAVLQAIQKREVALLCLFTLAEEYGRGEMSTVEFQRKGVRLLSSLQASGHQVVIEIDRWRDQLTRPYPFMFHGGNYLLKIISDNHQLSSSALNQVIPLRLYEYPLCSHLPSLEALTQEMALDGLVTYPLYAGKTGYFRELSPKRQGKLQRAEAYIKTEFLEQQNLIRELKSLAERDMFLPILNTPVIAGCLTGISLRSAEWGSRLHQALEHAQSGLSVSKYQALTPLQQQSNNSLMASSGDGY